MNTTKPYFKIRPDGTVNVQPAPPNHAKIDYSKKPVHFAVRRDPLGLEIHGEDFSTLMATSNSPTFGQSNSPRQDG